MLMSEKYCSFPHPETFGSICLAGDGKWEPRAGNESQMEGVPQERHRLSHLSWGAWSTPPSPRDPLGVSASLTSALYHLGAPKWG